MRLVILDRDGVINEDSDDYIRSPDEFIPIPGSLEAIARLKNAGFTVAVATNQSGIGRAYFDLETLHAMHEKLRKLLAGKNAAVDGIFYCPHTPEDQCDCRKPAPGLYQQIGRLWNVELTGIPVIGDSLRDLEAARVVGAKPILVRSGKGRRTLAEGKGLEGVPVYDDLSQAVDAILSEEI